jgi:hypothetical protein
MRSAKHVSINELKKQPRLGMALADEMKKFADGMAKITIWRNGK